MRFRYPGARERARRSETLKADAKRPSLRQPNFAAVQAAKVATVYGETIPIIGKAGAIGALALPTRASRS
jgi:hypothetical protein